MPLPFHGYIVITGESEKSRIIPVLFSRTTEVETESIDIQTFSNPQSKIENEYKPIQTLQKLSRYSDRWCASKMHLSRANLDE